MGYDWNHYFLPALHALVSGQNPYSVPGFYNPVWILFPLIPLLWLPAEVSLLVFSTFGFFGFAAIMLFRRIPLYALVAFMLSPVVIFTLVVPTSDWIPLVGLFLPPPIGLCLVLLKPQLGLGIALYWGMNAYRNGGWKSVLRTFGPVATLGLANLALYGTPPAGELQAASWNLSLFPWSIPLGLALLGYALRRSKPLWTVPASLCLSPYVGWSSFVGIFPALPPLGIVATSLVLWAYRFLR